MTYKYHAIFMLIIHLDINKAQLYLMNKSCHKNGLAITYFIG